MSLPPSYEESTTGSESKQSEKRDSKDPERWNLRAQVGASRTQHASEVAWNLAPQVRDRAKRGLSKSSFVLLAVGDGRRPKGDFVSFEESRPIVIYLDSPEDIVEFWQQKDALSTLRTELYCILAGEMPMVENSKVLPSRPTVQSKKSWWSRKSSNPPEPQSISSPPIKERVLVEVQWDDVHFRTETEAGLLETARGQGILVVVDVGSF